MLQKLDVEAFDEAVQEVILLLLVIGTGFLLTRISKRVTFIDVCGFNKPNAFF